MILSRNTSVGVPLVDLLKASLLASCLLAPPINNLPIAATCVGLEGVGTIACIYSFVMCAFFIALLTNFQRVLYSWTAKRIKKHKIIEEKTSGWGSALFPQYDTISSRMQSFNKWSLSVKHLSEAGFFNSGKRFHHRVCLVHKATILLKTN